MSLITTQRALEVALWSLRRRVQAWYKRPALPDFMIIGAQKSGTEFLHAHLERHPSIEIARRAGLNSRGRTKVMREMHYFSNDEIYERGSGWYSGHFLVPRSGGRTLWGERTPNYLCKARARQRILDLLPSSKFIVLLRNPVDRAYSHYQMKSRKGKEDRPFEVAIAEAVERYSSCRDQILENVPGSLEAAGTECDLVARGFYAYQLSSWYRLFDESQFLVLRSESMFQRPARSLSKALAFLELDDIEIPRFVNSKARSYPAMSPRMRAELCDYYAPFNRRLDELAGRDFGWDS